MTQNQPQQNSAWAAVRRLLVLSGRHQFWLYLAMLMAVLATIAQIVGMFYLARFIDAVTIKETSLFSRYLAITVALSASAIPLGYLRVYSMGNFGERTMARLRSLLAQKATILPIAYLEKRHSGDFLSVVNADLGRLQLLLGSSLVETFSQAFLGIGALIALFLISWQLALVSTLMIPFMYLIMGRLTQPITARTEERQQALGEAISIAQDSMNGVMVTKAFNLAQLIAMRFTQANQLAVQKGLQVIRLQAGADGGGMVFNILPFLVTFGFGGYLTINGYLTFGLLAAFINMLNYVANPLGTLPRLLASIAEASGAAQRTFELLTEPAERQGGRGKPLQADQTIIRMQHVHFSYGEDTVLRDVSMEVNKGQTVAIVGPSGGGKSTLLKLLLGYYPVDSATILINGQDINAWNLPELRNQMAFVAQDTYLFPTSIAENIACGNPGATQEQIEQAARMANIHEYITTLPEGYHTSVGERGAKLSGGQRQRISLARAILKDAPILLLDEPTSALDTESEALIQDAMERFMADRTTIVIAHRLSTIRNAHAVLVLEDGIIAERGTHEELMNIGGRYKELYLRQFDTSSQAPKMENAQ